MIHRDIAISSAHTSRYDAKQNNIRGFAQSLNECSGFSSVMDFKSPRGKYERQQFEIDLEDAQDAQRSGMNRRS